MKMAYRASVGAVLVLLIAACNDYLTTDPQTIVTDDQIWSNPTLVLNVLADFYDRIPEHQSLRQNNNIMGNGDGPWQEFTTYDEAVYSGVTAGAQFRNNLVNYPYSQWVGTGNNTVWHQSYNLIRDINLALDNVEAGRLSPAQKSQVEAELRFLRALVYFELVKRVGGVPLITSQQIYDFSGDVSPLQVPRATEAAVYDFIASELDAIADRLGNEGSRVRANRYAALALKSRATLYAGSIARYNNNIASLPGGEVGIPATRAAEYYQKSLEASRAIITSGQYALVQGPNPGVAFNDIFVTKGHNEMILAKDYRVAQGKKHFFTMQVYPKSVPNQPFANWGGAAISASLNLVENFDYLDGSPGVMRGTGDGTPASQANWIFYNHPSDIFAGKDGRLWGTVMYPGATFAGQELELQAGVYVWNAAQNRYMRESGPFGSRYTDGGILTGTDGPLAAEVYTSATGFYIRKHVDPTPAGASISGTDTWWTWFRLGEIYMNAAEAAFELNMQGEALTYVNRLRERAGFPANSLNTLSLQKIQQERWNELAFEDHRVWDLRRWRTAHLVWDGAPNSTTANVYALYPYRVIRPGHPDHNKYVFDKFPASIQGAPRFFRPGNYYSEIPTTVIGANPKLVRNPFH
jgi:starch-binding outer membrane protein, SusD/RagB family